MSASNLRRLERLLERCRPRRQVIVYENDWCDDRPNPTPEELADPGVDVLIIRYVADWPPPAEPFPGKV